MKVVFLDTCHWIYLAQACTQRDPKYADAAKALRHAVEEGRVLLPLQMTHLFELQRNADAGRRERLVRVMQDYSNSWFYRAWSDLMAAEFRAALPRLFDLPAAEKEVFPLVRGPIAAMSARIRSGLRASFPGRPDFDLLAFLNSMPNGLVDMITTQDDAGRKEFNRRGRELNDRDTASVQGRHGCHGLICGIGRILTTGSDML